MVLTNSELPLCLMDKNTELNSYDFVLFHLYKENEDYRNYFSNSRFKSGGEYMNRKMILDNSAYEFFVKGEKLNLDEYINIIQELNPDYFILPDILMDKEGTLNGTKEFITKYFGMIDMDKAIGVLQGITSEEMLECMDEYNKIGITHIAIPFHNSFFKKIRVYDDISDEFVFWYNNEFTEDQKYAMGRVTWIYDNIDYIKKCGANYIHILGSHCPLEKIFYNDMDIQSMDTAYPVKCALAGDELFEEKNKPDIILDEFIDKELDKNTKDLIIKNVLRFKGL